MIRIDFIFSYWIFAWYLLYTFGVTNFNPKFALIGGVIENSFLLVLMLYKSLYWDALLFVFINTILKLYPLYSIWKTSLKIKDIMFTFGLFIVYELWLRINGTNTIIENKKTIDSILTKKYDTPLMKLFKTLFQSTNKAERHP
jgi:hypothetical protein